MKTEKMRIEFLQSNFFFRSFIFFLHISMLILFFAVPSLFLISDHTFSNWDNQELEEFMKSTGIKGRFYIEGARPYFIRRSASQGSVFFYDLNPRVKKIELMSEYEKIDHCFEPDYWVVTKIFRSQEVFESVKASFSDIIFAGKDMFISKKLTVKKMSRATIDCKKIKMKG